MAGMSTGTRAKDLWKRRTYPVTVPTSLRFSKTFGALPAPPGPTQTAATPDEASSGRKPPSDAPVRPSKLPGLGPDSSVSTQTSTTPGTSDPAQNPPSPVLRERSSLSFKRLLKTATRVSLFLASDDVGGSGGQQNAKRSAGVGGSDPAEEESAPGRNTHKFLFSLAAVSMENRRHSGGPAKGGPRRESGSGYNRLLGLTGTVRRSSGSAEQRASTLSGANKMATLATLLGLKHRAHERVMQTRSKVRWKKLRVWARVVGVLAKLLRKHAASAMTDPASPFYSSQTAGDLTTVPVEELFEEVVDKDHDDMLFDPSRFKANRQRRMPQEAKKILSKPSEDRTPEEIYYAMIALRNIHEVAVFPVRMQRNLAQFGEIQCFEAKRRILRQGHKADGFYVILYGNVIVAVKNEETGFAKIVVELPRGEAFGDIAIVSGGTRNSSVLTKTYTELLFISKTVYENIFLTGGMKCINDPDHHEFVSSLSFLRGWPIEKLSDKESEKCVRFMYIQRDIVIMRNSNFTNWLLVVKSGSVKVLKKLVRSKPTVSKRSGLYRHVSCASAFDSFITGAREYDRWLTSRGVTLPSPLQAHDDDDDEVGEEEEEEVGEEEAEESEEEDMEEGKEEDAAFDDEDMTGETEDEEAATEDLTDENIKGHCQQRRNVDHVQQDQYQHYLQQQDLQHHPANDDHHHHPTQQRPRERKRGVVHHVNEDGSNKNSHSHISHHPPRPHTWVKGDFRSGPHAARMRKAWSAKHTLPASSIRTSSANNKPPHLSKRNRLTTPKIRFDMQQNHQDKEPDIPQEIKFALAKRTVLDDMDAAYLSRAHPVTEADIHPQFVYVQTLTKGDVFGLAPLVFPDQPSLCLVSNGAELMFIDKRFYLDNCPPDLSRRLKTEVSPYPSESKLQQDLVNRINWDVYKKVVKRQVYQQCPSRVTMTPL